MKIIEVGQRIKQCRRNKNLTQEKLAEMIGVSPHYIYEIERGLKTMSIQTLSKITIHLNVSADYLLFGDDRSDNTAVSKNEADSLDNLIHDLPASKRENLEQILSFLLPYIK